MSLIQNPINKASVLLSALLLWACSNEEASGTAQAVTQANVSELSASEANTNKASSLEGEAAVQYQMPTFIGADPQAQTAMLNALNQQDRLSELAHKQQLLLRLSLFSSDQDQQLSTLQAISDDLIKASELSAKQGYQDYELMAAMGSALSYQSIFYQDDLGKMNLLSRKGMRYMDRAVKKVPNHLGVRLLRGISYANMPAFLNRSSFAVEDLSLLKSALLAAQKTNQVDRQSQAAELSKKSPFKKQDKLFIEFIDYYLALSFYKNAKLQAAKNLWQSLEKNASDKWASLARTRLKEV